jgi:hypothetical protein
MYPPFCTAICNHHHMVKLKGYTRRDKKHKCKMLANNMASAAI